MSKKPTATESLTAGEKTTATEPAPAGEQFYEAEPGKFAGHVAEQAFRQLAENVVRFECQTFAASGDEVHLWRAWRAARACGEVSRTALAMLAPHLDKLAAHIGKSPTRADQREHRNEVLVAYYHEVDRMREKRPEAPRSLAEARSMVAERFDISSGAVEQMVLDHEKRKGKGIRHGPRH